MPLIDTGLPAAVAEHDVELGRSPSFKKRKRSKLGLLPLVALIFYEVSGGPFGTEVGSQQVTFSLSLMLQSSTMIEVIALHINMHLTCCKLMAVFFRMQ